MTLMELWRQCNGILPELIVAATICVVIFVDMLTPLYRSRARSGMLSLIGTLCALWVLASRMGHMDPIRPLTFGSMITHDQISVFFRLVFLIGSAATILFSMRSVETEGYRHGEYFTLLLGAVLGAMFVVAADNLVMFLLGFETLSICCYVLASFIKHERPSAEAGLKYMIYGAVASGIMMFGLSYVYGISGTLGITKGLSVIAIRLTSNELPHLAVFFVLTLVMAGIGFKIAMVPFQFWCPDVYQGSPTPITAFLAVVSKAAGFGALLRFTLPFFVMARTTSAMRIEFLPAVELPIFFGVLSMATMTFGNLVALRQTDVKRMLAYSSIAHAGYLLMGMTVFDRSALVAIMFYFFIYLIMNLGAFWIVIVLVNRIGSAEIDRFNGVARKAPFLFVAMFLFLISLTGLPPTAGFVGKFMLFKVVIGAAITHMSAAGAMSWMAWFYLAVALVGLLNSAISLYYYMTIARAMAFRDAEDDRPLGDTRLDRVYAAAFAVPVLVLLYFVPVLNLIENAGH